MPAGIKMQVVKWIVGHPVRLVAVLGGVAGTLGAAKLASPYVMRKLCDKVSGSCCERSIAYLTARQVPSPTRDVVLSSVLVGLGT